ncbi:MAG: DNA polymerase IV [Chloroflexota bacterium]
MTPPRIIFHVDLDAFFAAVERTLNPDLVGKPLIIGGMGPRGVVSCASYEVRPFGVRSAMPMSRARRLCPHAVVLPGRHELYVEVSRQFMAILQDYTPHVQAMSVDEAYMDMTGTERLHGPPAEVAEVIRGRIRDELNVTASVGVAPSRLVAKIASDERKPDGLFIVPEGGSASYLAPKPLRALPGIGPRAAQVLESLGIRTLGELAECPASRLRRVVGAAHAEELRRRARGEDDSPVEDEREAKSISAETTFQHDLQDGPELRHALRWLSERVGNRLRRSGKHARVVSLKLRFADFSTITRQRTMRSSFNGDGAIEEGASALLERELAGRSASVRLIGVGVESFSEPSAQLSLMDDTGPRDTALSGTLDRIRSRFGRGSVRRGAG